MARRGNIQKRPNGSWRARIRDDDGKEVASHHRTKAEAEDWLDEKRQQFRAGIDSRAGSVCFMQYAEQWRQAQLHRPSTAVHHETMLRRHVYPSFGDRPLKSIKPSQVQAWVQRLSTTLAPSTVGVVHRIVAGIFNAAVRDKMIASSPCSGTRLPKVARPQIDPLTSEQVNAIADAVPVRYRALIILGATTGMRQGECLGLTLDRIDFLRRTVKVDRQLSLVQNQDPFLSPPKTLASYRVIPLPQTAVDALAAHCAEFPPCEAQITVRADGGATRTEIVQLVFTDEEGLPIRRTAFSSKVWRPASKLVGLEPGEGFHGLRHFFASLLIRHGENVKTVQARLGHANASETLDTYSHLWPDHEDRTRDAVDGVFRRPSADHLRTGNTSSG